MVHPRLQVPTGHGELLTYPGYEEWAELARSAASMVASWDTEIGGVPVAELREQARREAVDLALEYTSEIGISTREAETDLVVATGHQPELYHPGIWVKDFLLQRLAEECGAQAIDFVVDSDTFDSVALSVPCLVPDVRVCKEYLAMGSPETCYAQAPTPDVEALSLFRSAGAEGLGSLPAPSVARHFESYCDSLEEAAARSGNLADTLVLARRLYERAAGTDYLEAKVTAVAKTPSYLRLLAHIALDAQAFAAAHNDELHSFRAATKTRSRAQPFPDLALDGDLVELPIWAIADVRRPAYARRGPSGIDIVVDGKVAAVLGEDDDAAVRALADCETVFAPRALMLTLYVRMLVADLFIHGVGGARYDAVTDGLAARYFGLTLPPYVAASLTMYLPLGVPLVSEQEVADARADLHRLTHNPDALLSEAAFDSADELRRAEELAARKAQLVAAIAEPGADKKSIGADIRAVNDALGRLLQPVETEMRSLVERLEREYEASGVLTDRSYPFCLWSPLEVQDKVT